MKNYVILNFIFGVNIVKWHKIFMEQKSEKFFFKIKFSLNEFWECNMMLLFAEVTHETRIKGKSSKHVALCFHLTEYFPNHSKTVTWRCSQNHSKASHQCSSRKERLNIFYCVINTMILSWMDGIYDRIRRVRDSRAFYSSCIISTCLLSSLVIHTLYLFIAKNTSSERSSITLCQSSIQSEKSRAWTAARWERLYWTELYWHWN